MSLFNHRVEFRAAPGITAMIQELMKEYPYKYYTISDVVRVAVIKLHKTELPKSKIPLEFK